MSDRAFVRQWIKHHQDSAWQEFEDELRGILVDHENAVAGANEADTYAARRRTVDKIEALYIRRSTPAETPTGGEHG